MNGQEVKFDKEGNYLPLKSTNNEKQLYNDNNPQPQSITASVSHEACKSLMLHPVKRRASIQGRTGICKPASY